MAILAGTPTLIPRPSPSRPDRIAELRERVMAAERVLRRLEGATNLQSRLPGLELAWGFWGVQHPFHDLSACGDPPKARTGPHYGILLCL